MMMKRQWGSCAAVAILYLTTTGVAHAVNTHFGKVPSDTPLYIGTTVDEHWLSSLGLGDADSLRQALSKLSASGPSADGKHSDTGRFVQVIAEAMLQGGQGGLELVAQPGRFQFYLQGVAPVLRLQLRDGRQFESFLNKQALKAVASIVSSNEGTQKIWTPVGGNPDLFAAVDGDDLIMARLSQSTGYPAIADVVAGGAGLDAASSVLPAMSRYDMPGSTVGWLDFERLKTSVADPDHALHAVIQEQVADTQKWEQFLSPACQGDIQRFVDNTPHVVGAVSYAEQSEQRAMQAAFVWPMRDEKARAAWQGLQGLVLGESEASTPVSLGLGVSGSGVPGFINYIASDLSALQCPLWRDQAAQSGMGLAMASSMSALFSTVKGISAQVFDADLDANRRPVPSTLDAQLTVLSDSPSLLLLMMRSMLTLPAHIPEDGMPVTVETPFALPVQLSVYPHSINVFRGARAAESVKTMKLGVATESALFNYAIDILWALTKSGESMPGKSPEDLLRENGAEAMIPLSVDGGVHHLPYGMRLESNAIYAKSELKKPAGRPSGRSQSIAALHRMRLACDTA